MNRLLWNSGFKGFRKKELARIGQYHRNRISLVHILFHIVLKSFEEFFYLLVRFTFPH